MSELKQCQRCLFTEDITPITEGEDCSYCKLQDKQRAAADIAYFWPIIHKIKHEGETNQYDCLIGISGGEDSSTLLWLAVKIWGLRPLVIHFNNRTNRAIADNNMKVLTEHLNVNFIQYYLDKQEYEELGDSLLKAGVPDMDIHNDVCMSKIQVKVALDHGIKYIINGHDFRHEGSSPKAWSFIDTTYLKSIYKHWTNKELKNYPLLTVWDQIWSAIIGIRKISPFHYSTHARQTMLAEMRKIGYQDYGGKHNENIYTAFIGNYVLPKKFGIDKRRTYLSAQIREGKISKAEAKNILKTPATFNLDDLGARKEHLLNLVENSPIMPRETYKSTNFKLYRPLFWVLMKLGVFPKSAFRKYCF